VLTIHASKGKEADTVALYDGIPGAVQRNIRGDPREQRAESRVWYVGCTRAAENLLVFRDQFDYTDSYLPSTA
jgi:superfamily I DNA/RNA helicase